MGCKSLSARSKSGLAATETTIMPETATLAPEPSLKNASFQIFPDLRPWEYAALKESIGRFGVLLPIVQDEHGNTIDGHQRERACRELGVTNYGIVTLAGQTEEQKRDQALVLNLVRRR